MEQQGDPGYKATSVLLGECGLALALDRDKLAELHGVLTPAAAMGDALLARFGAAGVSLRTERAFCRVTFYLRVRAITRAQAAVPRIDR